MGSTSSPSALKCLLGSQTCKTLSSAVLAKCHFAAGLQLISLGLEVCPPWTNINSGGPSSASSGVCSAPIWSRFQIWIRRSSEADAKWVPRWGDHATCVTCAEWDSKEWSLVEIFRISHNATVCLVSLDYHSRCCGEHTLSPEPVRRSHSLSGAKETALISDLWALSPWAGLGPVLRVSHLWISTILPRVRRDCRGLTHSIDNHHQRMQTYNRIGGANRHPTHQYIHFTPKRESLHWFDRYGRDTSEVDLAWKIICCIASHPYWSAMPLQRWAGDGGLPMSNEIVLSCTNDMSLLNRWPT